jgi:lipoprotein NlpD
MRRGSCRCERGRAEVMQVKAWIAWVSAALMLAGCATRTEAPVADRSTSKTLAVDSALAKSGAAARPSTYVVKRGDTLYSIATMNGMEARELAALNGISDPSGLHVGQVLVLSRPQSGSGTSAGEASGSVSVNPIATTAPVEARPLGAAGAPAPGATPQVPAGTAEAGTPGLKTGPKAVKLPYSEQNLALLRQGESVQSAVRQSPAPDQPAPTSTPAPNASGGGDSTWAWPAAGKIVSTFKDSGGKGVAIAGKLGDPVYASAPGTVVYSGEGLPSYGKLIIVKHNDEYLSVYAHNSVILVKEKQIVARGQKIAEIGTSGTGAPSPRLHFEIRRLGKTVDPEQLLPGRQ